jgi:hypothetical protein
MVKRRRRVANDLTKRTRALAAVVSDHRAENGWALARFRWLGAQEREEWMFPHTRKPGRRKCVSNISIALQALFA